jgi:hypothetical protein
MGTTRKLAYTIEYRDQSRAWNWCVWHVTGGPNRTANGRPTDANAERWRVAMNKSFQRGGTNAHLSEARGYVPHISAVRIVHQATGRIVARATMPMFEVIE